MRKVDPAKHEEKRAEIVAAAGRCFARNGFRGATVAQICAEAKISAGHLYHYFETKETIIEAMCFGVGYATSRVANILDHPEPLVAFIAEMERVNDGEGLAQPAIWLEILAEAARNPIIAESLRTSSAKLQDLISGFLRKGQTDGWIDSSLDTETSAAILLSLVDGAKALAVRSPALDRELMSETITKLINRFLSPPMRDLRQ